MCKHLFPIICFSVAMFTTDFFVSGISALNENIVVLTYEKEQLKEVKLLLYLLVMFEDLYQLFQIWGPVFQN